MGNAGVVIFAITLFLIVITSLFGNMIGLSNLLQSMAEDEAMPLFLKKLDKNETPRNAILAIMTVSFIIPFIGRVAIGWIVDVNTIGGSIVYTYIGATALKSSLEDKDKKSMVSGILGIAFGFAFSLIILIPNLFIEETMAKETFFIFVIWAIAGFIYFYYILRKDKKGLFGHSLFVLLGLVLLILLSSFIWANDVIEENNRDLINKLDIYYHTSSTTNDNYVFELEKASNRTVVGVVLTMILVIFIAQLILLASFIMIKKREVQHQKDLDIANELATKDSMTGVRNKHAYSTKENLMDEAINSNDNLEFAVVVCDVNNLKYINDNFGHEYGDKLIKDACALICNTFEHSPVYRVGGDEFVVILEGRDYQNRDELISKINATIEKNNLEEGIVIAIGISQFDKEKHFEFIDVFREADQNMYIRKQNLKEMKRNAKK